VLTYCVDVLRTLQDGLQRRLSPSRPAPPAAAAAVRDKAGGVAPVAMIRGAVAGREMEGGGARPGPRARRRGTVLRPARCTQF
jgi:hypothetical protein